MREVLRVRFVTMVWKGLVATTYLGNLGMGGAAHEVDCGG